MKMKNTARTKIVATIGPASEPKEVLREMFLSGLNVCRLNFSHGEYDAHLQVIKTIRELNQELGTHVAILADLQGPKLRVGVMKDNGVMLVEGKEFTFTNQLCEGTAEKAYMSYPEFPQDVSVGDDILIDDGKLKLEVIETNRVDTVKARVIYGGILSSKKGVNLPSTKISLPSLTEKDLADAEFALDQDVDWIALSFVRSATDIVELKNIIKKKKKITGVLAKIEKPEALAEAHNIVDLSDGIMVARGDLGVEVDFERVPLIQKSLVKRCMKASKPVIIATQMLESMITNFRPTRSEANDVANAVLDGTDAVMLSGETSVGKFPVEVIKTMYKIISHTENHAYKFYRGSAPKVFDRTFMADSISYHACKIAEQTKAKAIICFSRTGYTAYSISGYRPSSKIFAFTNNRAIRRKLSLIWGLEVFLYTDFGTIDDAFEYTIELLKARGELQSDDIVVHAASTPFHKKERTNMLKISYV